MHTGILLAELRIPGARSLKEKRSPLKSIIANLRNRFNCSVAEVGKQDAHQFASIGLAVVASDAKLLARAMHDIEEFIYRNRDFQVLSVRGEVVKGLQEYSPKSIGNTSSWGCIQEWQQEDRNESAED